VGNVGASLELRDVRKSYGIGKDRLVRAADDVSLTIEAGAFVALTGASGSGKSTLLHLIGAIERPDSGTIISNAQNVTALQGGALARYRRTVGFVFQSYHLLPALTALDNVIAPVLPSTTSPSPPPSPSASSPSPTWSSSTSANAPPNSPPSAPSAGAKPRSAAWSSPKAPSSAWPARSPEPRSA